VQYAASTGTFSSNITNLNGSISAGGYYLIQEASGGAIGSSLPVTPNATGSINIAATKGKVALANDQNAISGLADLNVVDFVGFGSTANEFEGTGPTSDPGNTSSVRRKDNNGNSTYGSNGSGTDSDDNSADFYIENDLVTNAPLPVQLTSFTANQTKAGVMLNWTTATEVNNYGFQVESRKDKGESEWEKVGFVEGHGNSNSPKEYSFFDNSGATSYRLKQVDFNGNYEYSDVVTVSSVLTKTELYQNSPNPFNPSTKISFSLAETGRVNVSVYNVIGQKVAELVNQTMESGIHNVDFNASNFTSGLYIYRLETPNYSKTMKMLLIK